MAAQRHAVPPQAEQLTERQHMARKMLHGPTPEADLECLKGIGQLK